MPPVVAFDEFLKPPLYAMNTELAAIYRRVSTDKQDDSLELQERRTLDYARMKGLVVDDTRTFSDPDTSGGIPITERDGGRLLMNQLTWMCSPCDIAGLVVVGLLCRLYKSCYG